MQARSGQRFLKGLTLIELLITVAIVTILALLAVPSFQRMMDTRRVVGAADNLLAELRHAQTESVKRNVQVKFQVTPGTSTWSYTTVDGGLNTGSTADDTNIKTVSSTDYNGIQFSFDVSGKNNTITFDPKRGTVLEAGTAEQKFMTMTSQLGTAISVQIDPASRIRLCSPTRAGGLVAC